MVVDREGPRHTCWCGAQTMPDCPGEHPRAGNTMPSGRRPAVVITAGRSRAPPTTVAYNEITVGDGPPGRGGAVAAPNSPITYILPDEGWAPLLEIIVRECPAASVIEVNTAGMQALAERMLREGSRQDVTVALRPPRGVPSPPAQSS